MAGEMWQLEKTPLGHAIVQGDPYNVRRLIEQGEDVLYKDRKGNTYLHYICTMYKPYVFNVLCAFGVPLNAQNVHGNTALHISAIHSECCHVPDLMQCGVHPHIRNKDGKIASDLAKQNKRWLDLYSKYEPTLLLAVTDHDTDAVIRLFESWSAVHLPIDIQNGFNMRNYSAAMTYHDIVSMIDRVRFSLMAVYAIKECDYKSLEYALSRGKEICDVNYLQNIRGHPPHHMLQHAVRLNDVRMVKMLLEAGADVNIRVLVNEYFQGPLFFEVLRTDQKIDMEIIKLVLASDIDLDARDEHGRTALIYCTDKRDNQDVAIEIIEILLDRGINIAHRDNTGCTARDVALFARRHDITSCIDEYIVTLIRESDITTLTKLAMYGYTDLFMEHMSRDTWIYAAGNETNDVTEHLQQLQDIMSQGELFHEYIQGGKVSELELLLESSDHDKLLLTYRDKGGRGPLTKAIMYDKVDIAQYLVSKDPDIIQRETDNSGRTVLHYIEALPTEKKMIFQRLINTECLKTHTDVCGNLPEVMNQIYPHFIEEEKPKDYGMEKQVHCMQKYELLLEVIRSRYKKLKHFNKILKTLKYPVAEFPKIFHPGGHPLVTGYRDLLLCAVDHRKEDIARRLVHLQVDCSVTTTYENDCLHKLNAEQRAEQLGMLSLSEYIRDKGVKSRITSTTDM